MRPLFPRLSIRSLPVFSCTLLLVAGLLGACDRHSATEASEGYGHGSARQPSYDSHAIDSHTDFFTGEHSKSFSDTRGVAEEGKASEKGEHKAAPGESPTPSQPGRFFPGGTH